MREHRMDDLRHGVPVGITCHGRRTSLGPGAHVESPKKTKEKRLEVPKGVDQQPNQHRLDTNKFSSKTEKKTAYSRTSKQLSKFILRFYGGQKVLQSQYNVI